MEQEEEDLDVDGLGSSSDEIGKSIDKFSDSKMIVESPKKKLKIVDPKALLMQLLQDSDIQSIQRLMNQEHATPPTLPLQNDPRAQTQESPMEIQTQQVQLRPTDQRV